MSSDFSHDDSGVREKAALQERCKLPSRKFQNEETGRVETHAHPRQEEIDALAETDLEAAAALADKIREKDSSRAVKHELNETKLRGEGARLAEKRKANEAARAAERLQTRRLVVAALEGLNGAKSIDAFLQNAEALADQQANLSSDDLKIYGLVRDQWKSRQGALTREQISRFAHLEKLDEEVDHGRRQGGQMFKIHETVEPQPQKIIAQAPRRPPSLLENLRALIGWKNKE